MLERVSAVEFVRKAKNGRTRPLILVCEKRNGELVEVFCKLSNGCDEHEISLMREMLGACLAADLGLPVPEPFFVDLNDDFIASVPDIETANRMRHSSPVGFGSRIVSNQYGVWIDGSAISDVLLQLAASVFLFDGIVQNPDRRVGNSNCLVRGDDIRIIDHELAFSHGVILGWRPPWEIGGLQSLALPGNHIFFGKLKGRDIDFVSITNAWKDLSDARITEYVRALPKEWATAAAALNDAVTLVADARDQIDRCIVEARRVLE